VSVNQVKLVPPEFQKHPVERWIRNRIAARKRSFDGSKSICVRIGIFVTGIVGGKDVDGMPFIT